MNAATPRPRTLTRIVALTGACALAVVSLTACLNIEADVAIDSQAKGTGTFTFALQKQAATFLGMTDLNSFKSGLTEQDMTAQGGDILSSDNCTASEDAENFIYACTFADAEFTEDTGPWTITKEGESIVFHMKNEGSEAPEAGASADPMAGLLGGGSMGEITVNVTFPGPITAITGAGATKNSDTTATISGSMTDTLDVTITSEAAAKANTGLIIAGVIGLLVAIVLVIGLVLLIMRGRGKKSGAQTEAVIAGEGTEAASAATVVGAAVATDGDTVVSEVVAEPAIVEDVVVADVITPAAPVESVVESVAEEAPVAEPPVDEPPAPGAPA